MELSAATWPDLDRPIVVVPLGSCEQHGPHLPLGTDTIIARALATALVERRDDALVGPTLPVGASGEHDGFPGTLSIGIEVLVDVLVEIVRSADWADGVVVVNGHGGNASALRRAERRVREEGRAALMWSPLVAGGDLHAGRTETSLMLAVAPDLVRPDLAVDGPTPAIADLAADGVRAHTPSGVLGAATEADVVHGRQLFERLVDDLAAAVAAWRDR